jgi:crotonobetainyl-CoA:carnitine CoA-transferase CaiB-like acyl-CoA transferase
MPGPLTGVRVLDLSRVLSGPVSTQVLVDLGAEVLKIEDPREGDAKVRDVGIKIEGMSACFATINRCAGVQRGCIIR